MLIETCLPLNLILSHRTRERMKLPYMADQCEMMLKISSEFVRLQVSHDEYLCMKVLLLLSTGETLRDRAFLTLAVDCTDTMHTIKALSYSSY